jgi:hypothetical protein
VNDLKSVTESEQRLLASGLPFIRRGSDTCQPRLSDGRSDPVTVSQLRRDFLQFVGVVRGPSSGAQFMDTICRIYGPDYHAANLWMSSIGVSASALHKATPRRFASSRWSTSLHYLRNLVR